jgi:hypothetical protein
LAKASGGFLKPSGASRFATIFLPPFSLPFSLVPLYLAFFVSSGHGSSYAWHGVYLLKNVNKNKLTLTLMVSICM